MLEYSHTVQALAPDADALAGTVNTDVIGLTKYHRVRFVIQIGVGATGATLVKVQACDDFTPTATSVIAARYRIATSGDSFGAWTALTTSGLTVGAASNQTIEIDVQDDELPAGYPNVRLNMVESTDSPVDAAISAILLNPRYPGEPALTAIA